MRLPCIQCKGRDPSNCGRTFCPIVAKVQSSLKTRPMQSQDYQGPAPAPFVGRQGYPDINVGILSTKDTKDPALLDNPRRWAQENTQLRELIDLRTSLVNANFNAHVKNPHKMVSLAQEVAMAKRPVDMEVHLDRPPTPDLTPDAFSAPTGPKAKLLQARATENASISSRVEKVFADTDWKAKDAISYLYNHDHDENELAKLLSVGATGTKARRKLVPTRWSITATDDMICQELIKQLYDYPEIDYQAYMGAHLGNYFLVLTLPGPWSFELFEMYQPHTSWNAFSDTPAFSTDYEGPFGRKAYAHETAGGYYASRLPIVEHLKRRKRNGSVIALRIITGEYAVPMGVWVVREAVRKAMASMPVTFDSKSLLLDYAKARLKRFYNLDITPLFRRSRLLEERKQPTISSFL